MQQQNQLGGIQVQQGQMGLHDQQVLSQLMQSGKYNMGDPNSVRQMATDAGQAGASPNAVMALSQKSIDQQQKIASTAQGFATAAQRNGAAAKTALDMQNEKATKAGVIAQTINDPQQAQQALAQLDAQYPVPQGMQGYVPLAQKYGDWSPQSKAMLIANATTMNQAHAAAFGENKETPNGLVNIKTPIDSSQNPTVTPIGAAPAQSPVAKAALDLKNGLIDQNTYNLIKAKETHIPPQTTVNVMPGGGVPAQADQFGQDPTKPWRSNAGFQSLAQKNGQLATSVDQYLNGDYKIMGGRNAAVDRQIQMEAAKIDPNVTQHDYDIKQKALADPAVNATNAALGHIGDFKGLLNQLPAQTQAKILNTPLNKLAQAFTDSPYAQTISALQTTALSLSEEYGKALGAGQNVSGDLKRENVFDPSKPIGQLTSNLSAVGHLMNQTISSKENMLNRNNPNRVPMSLLDPGASDVLKSLGINHTPGNRPLPTGITPGMVPKRSDGSVLPDGHYHGFVVQGGKVTSAG
jgi:hypothetical protein